MVRRLLREKIASRLLAINDTPRSIALGTALGVFIAMTPTVGVQMILVLIVNTLCRANRLAGVIMVYISNPLTMIPIYWLDYQIGVEVLRMRSVSHDSFESSFRAVIEHAGAFEIWAAIRSLFAMSPEIIVPTFVGGGLLGLACAVPAYPITIRFLEAHRKRRERRDSLLRLREQRRREREDAQAAGTTPVAERRRGEGDETGDDATGADSAPTLAWEEKEVKR